MTLYFISPKKLASRRFYTLCEASTKLSILGPPLTPGQMSAKAQALLRVILIQPGTDNKDTETQRDGFHLSSVTLTLPWVPVGLSPPLFHSSFSLGDSHRPKGAFLTFTTGPLGATRDRGLWWPLGHSSFFPCLLPSASQISPISHSWSLSRRHPLSPSLGDGPQISSAQPLDLPSFHCGAS